MHTYRTSCRRKCEKKVAVHTACILEPRPQLLNQVGFKTVWRFTRSRRNRCVATKTSWLSKETQERSFSLGVTGGEKPHHRKLCSSLSGQAQGDARPPHMPEVLNPGRWATTRSCNIFFFTLRNLIRFRVTAEAEEARLNKNTRAGEWRERD